MSSLARTLGSWVRIPLKAWMSVSVYSVFLLSCVLVAALRRADPSFKSPTDCVYIREQEKRPIRAVEPQKKDKLDSMNGP
jgi:hypothetical protein